MTQQLHYVNDEWKIISHMSVGEIREALELHRSLLKRLENNKRRIGSTAERMIPGLLRRVADLEDAYRNLSNQSEDTD